MADDILNHLARILGIGTDELAVHEMALRAVVVYSAALIMVRWGEKRFLGKNTAFDVIFGVILGSVVSRAITGQSPFLATIVAGFVLVGMHWLLAKAAFRSEGFASLVKGGSRVLVRDGEIDWDQMRRSDLGNDDLRAALRVNGGLGAVEDVQEARLERSGDISVIEAKREPRILRAELSGKELTITVELR